MLEIFDGEEYDMNIRCSSMHSFSSSANFYLLFAWYI